MIRVKKTYKGGWDVRFMITYRDHTNPIISKVEVAHQAPQFIENLKEVRKKTGWAIGDDDGAARKWAGEDLYSGDKDTPYYYWQIMTFSESAVTEGDGFPTPYNDFGKVVKVHVEAGKQTRDYVIECEAPPGWNGNAVGEKLSNGTSIPYFNVNGRFTIKGEGVLFSDDSEPPKWFN